MGHTLNGDVLASYRVGRPSTRRRTAQSDHADRRFGSLSIAARTVRCDRAIASAERWSTVWIVPSSIASRLMRRRVRCLFDARRTAIEEHDVAPGAPRRGVNNSVNRLSDTTRQLGPNELGHELCRAVTGGGRRHRSKTRLRRWLSRTVRLGPSGRFVSSTYIPQYAWLEATVNATVHRSYSMAGDHIRVHVFSNRLEVESPDRLPGLVRVETIRTTRFARNPRVARAVAELGYGRELGEGVDRMFEEMQAAGLPDPLFEQRSSGVTVTFLADPLSARLLRFLPGGSERFVEHLSRVGRVTTGQAATLMRVSRPTARTYLQQLEQLGLIEPAGTSVNDPRGYWALVRGPVR